ncbi:hypothetical protein ACLOJK_034929, partial [Asimina triloba]
MEKMVSGDAGRRIWIRWMKVIHAGSGTLLGSGGATGWVAMAVRGLNGCSGRCAVGGVRSDEGDGPPYYERCRSAVGCGRADGRTVGAIWGRCPSLSCRRRAAWPLAAAGDGGVGRSKEMQMGWILWR